MGRTGGYQHPCGACVTSVGSDLSRLTDMINAAATVAIFGGDGCRDAREEVIELAARLKATVGYALRGKQWLEHDNPYAVGLTGLLGYGGAYRAINHADLLLILGTDFPFSDFLPGAQVRKVQIDQNPKQIGRRTSLDLGLVGELKATLQTLLENVREKTDDRFLRKYVAETESFAELKQHYVDNGPGIKPIRPEYLAATLCKLASDDAMFFADTGTAVMWLARHIKGGKNRRLFGSFSWASIANAAPNAFGAQLAYPGRQTIAICGDGGFTMLGMGDLLTQVERNTPVIHTEQRVPRLREYRAAGSRLHSLWSGIQEPELRRGGRSNGAKGIRIEEPDAVSDGLTEALAHKTGRCSGCRGRPLCTRHAVARTFSYHERLHAKCCETSAKRQNGQPHKNGRIQYKTALTRFRRE